MIFTWKIIILFLTIKFIKHIDYKYIGPVPTNDKQTPPLSIDPTFMEDAQEGETKGKTIFRSLFFELSWKIHRKLGCWRPKNDDNSINNNQKNLKFDFFSDSTDFRFTFEKIINFYFILIYAYPCMQNIEAWLGEICRWR